jgi:hypothetical protein
MIVYLGKSNKEGKRYMVLVNDKTIHFGSTMSNYTMHKDMERKKRYLDRHKARENWNKSGISSSGFWSRWLLWNKPTLSGSIQDLFKRFGVKIRYTP